jgi:hypothetical protein
MISSTPSDLVEFLVHSSQVYFAILSDLLVQSSSEFLVDFWSDQQLQSFKLLFQSCQTY